MTYIKITLTIVIIYLAIFFYKEYTIKMEKIGKIT
jgi:hypothetical protein